MKKKNPKNIRFITVDDWPTALEEIQRTTLRKPQYFRYVFVDSSDHVLAYSELKFSEREAYMVWTGPAEEAL